jgi:hypothetical protein
MTREELIMLAEKIIRAQGTEQEVIDNVLVFKQNVPDPEAGNYFVKKEYDDWTADQIVDKALRYNPIQL